MPRGPRIHIPGAFYHITQRGNAKKRIFFNDEDRGKFCLLMQEGVERFGHKIHAFCLMDNHVHLLVQASDRPIGKAMQNLAFRFSRRLNKKFNTTGHRFQGRYYSGLIDTDVYLHEVLKYIHLNPVKAKMVEKPEDYPWSSHNYYLSKDMIPWVNKDFCMRGFCRDPELSILQYQSFMTKSQSDDTISLIDSTAFEYFIGDEEFVARMQKKADQRYHLNGFSLEQICIACCSVYGEQERILKDPGRGRGPYINEPHKYISVKISPLL